MPGTRIEDQLSDQAATERRDTILAFRKQDGILYELMLQSPAKTYAADEVLFSRIVEGFRLTTLSNAACSNE